MYINFLTKEEQTVLEEQIAKYCFQLIINEREQYIINKANNKKALLVVRQDGSMSLCKGLRQNYCDWDNFTTWLRTMEKNYLGYKILLPSNLRSSDCEYVVVNIPFDMNLFLRKHKVKEDEIKRAITLFQNKYRDTSDIPVKHIKSNYLSLLKEKELIT